MTIYKRIDESVNSIEDELISLRRDFHKYAEVGWCEFRTASKVAAYLDKLGFELKMGKEVIKEESRMGLPSEEVLQSSYLRAKEQGAEEKYLPFFEGGFTGVVASLKTGKKGPVVALRFDMDANDLDEPQEGDHRPSRDGYASVNPRAMHACGHDAHTAIGLGLAKLVSELKDELTGEIRLIFQPAEEGVRGAKSMVDAGVLEGADKLFGMHIGFGVDEVGKVTCGDEEFLATTKYDVEYFGEASHAGSTPDLGKNAILAAATAVMGLYGISRHKAGASRINVGVMEGGSGRNVIPAYAKLKIETRGENTEINDYMSEKAMAVIEGAAKMQDIDFRVSEMGSAPSSKSSGELIELLKDVTQGIDNVKEFSEFSPFSGSEDITYMMKYMEAHGKPSAFLSVGTKVKGGHHNKFFDFDEKVIPLSVELLMKTIIKLQD